MHRQKWTNFLSSLPYCLVGLVIVTLILGCSTLELSELFESRNATAQSSRINPENWPLQESPMVRDATMEKEITALLGIMTLEEKVGQIMQADIGSVTPDEVREFNLGSVLNGGNSAPGNDVRAVPETWLALADEFWKASTDKSDGGVGIPVLWGTDAVHGHNNIVGATVFPHNIGLGAANNPALMKKIGTVTATEMLTTGLDWTFAPTIAVVRDDRWGRTYESYSEAPQIVASYAGELVEGIQGEIGSKEFLGETKMIATVKHFVGDGGTTDGKDQGNNETSEAELRDVQAAGYPAAIRSGVQVVMASFNAYHGRKMHGYKELLSDVLVGRLGFDGFVVGDWNGHGQVKGCTNNSCAASVNAGLDMFMAPDSWKQLYYATLENVRAGEISMARLDEAVARILRVKMRARLFEAGPPSSRHLAGDWSVLSSKEHKNIARDAVRQSLVLLKNNDAVLPINPQASILVTGDGADNIGKQAGGWTLSWQGTGNENSDFPNGQSIFDGLREAIEKAGGKAALSVDGSYETKPDIAIVVFGEDPYAEFQGDIDHLDFIDERGLTLLQKFKNEGIKTVAVFLSGRPMWVNPELNVSDAFVAAWLPGGQGGGIADVILANADGSPAYDFTGKLSFSWPKHPLQTSLNIGDDDYDPLFSFGYGLTYLDNRILGPLSEESLPEGASSARNSFIRSGDAAGSWRMVVRDAEGSSQITDAVAVSASGVFQTRSADASAQEDTRILEWSGSAVFAIEGNDRDYARESNGDMAIAIDYAVLSEKPVGNTKLEIWCSQDASCKGGVDITDSLNASLGQGWQRAVVKLSCFEQQGADMTRIVSPLVFRSQGPLTLQIATAELVANTGQASCEF